MLTKEEKLGTRRLYRESHREQLRAADTRWRKANPDKKRASDALYRATHMVAIHKRQKDYRDSLAGRTYNTTYTKAYYADSRNRLRNLIGGAFRRAAKAGLRSDLPLRDILMSAPPQVCACCGVQLDYSTRRGRNNRRHSPSLDRKDNTLGYTLANTRVICWRCNDVKGDATLTELEAVLAYLKHH